MPRSRKEIARATARVEAGGPQPIHEFVIHAEADEHSLVR
jgi:hypothetical protein